MKKNLLSVIALVCAAAALAAALFAAVNIRRLQAHVNALNRSNEALSQQIEEMSARMDDFFIEPTVTGVSDWNLTAAKWSDSSGADVTLSIIPVAYNENVTVRFAVHMDQQPMADVICEWNGSAYTATAGLPAMNGYTYSCIFESASGTDTQILASPDAPTVPVAVYLSDSLNSYANLLIDSWTCESSTLTVSAGFVQVQLPLIDADTASDPDASLSLRYNGEELHHFGVELLPGEGDGSFEAELSDVTFEIPEERSDDDHIELWLEVAIDGQTQSVCGAEWYPENGELLLVAG